MKLPKGFIVSPSPYKLPKLLITIKFVINIFKKRPFRLLAIELRENGYFANFTCFAKRSNLWMSVEKIYLDSSLVNMFGSRDIAVLSYFYSKHKLNKLDYTKNG